jgi:hypothetical protein
MITFKSFMPGKSMQWIITYSDESIDVLEIDEDIDKEIIECFEKRHLNVAKNIALFIIYDKNKRHNSIERNIEYFMNTGIYDKYEEDVDKYLEQYSVLL